MPQQYGPPLKSVEEIVRQLEEGDGTINCIFPERPIISPNERAYPIDGESIAQWRLTLDATSVDRLPWVEQQSHHLDDALRFGVQPNTLRIYSFVLDVCRSLGKRFEMVGRYREESMMNSYDRGIF